jgi:sn-1 stearoyl-lipid 9-desaturase
VELTRPERPFLAGLLKAPSYGWVGPNPRPTDDAIRREWLNNLVPDDRRRWLGIFTWALHLGLAASLPIYLLLFATPLGVAAGIVYAFLVLPVWGTFYLHRYGTHRAFKLRNHFWRAAAKHCVVQLIPEESYILSHHVHHRYSDQDGDPYDPRGGWWYCFLADANHQSIAWDLDEADFQRAAKLLSHLPVVANDYSGYRRWGSVAHPGRTVMSFLGNHLAWYAALWTLGGHGLALGVFSFTAFWLIGIRQFNFRAHGRGNDLQIDGEDFNRADLSVNRTLSAWLAGEWHNNHHLYPRSARAGFLPGQLDLAWEWIRVWRAIGAVVDVHDDTERFMAEHWRPWLARKSD